MLAKNSVINLMTLAHQMNFYNKIVKRTGVRTYLLYLFKFQNLANIAEQQTVG